MLDNSHAFTSAQQYAYDYIHTQIITGRYSGGMRLDIKEIAATLDVSRMPIREVLRQLHAEGLVTIRSNLGAVVTSLAPDEVDEIFEMRLALEVLVARHAAANGTKETAAELKNLKERMDRVRDDRLRWIQRHNEFHRYIAAVGGRQLLAREADRLRRLVQPYLLVYMNLYGGTALRQSDHDELLEAIISGNPRKAERSMRLHVRSAATGLVPFLRSRELPKPIISDGSEPMTE